MHELSGYGNDLETHFVTSEQGGRLEISEGSCRLTGFENVDSALVEKLTAPSVDIYVRGEELGLSVKKERGWDSIPLMNAADELAEYWLVSAREQLHRYKPLPVDFTDLNPDQVRVKREELNADLQNLEDQKVVVMSQLQELQRTCPHTRTRDSFNGVACDDCDGLI